MSLLTAKFENKCISINDISYDFYAEKYKGNITCRICPKDYKTVILKSMFYKKFIIIRICK